MTYVSEVLADSPVGFWMLDEASGTNAADSSGNGYNGTYQNTPTLGVAGPIQGHTAVHLSGASSNYVQIATHTALHVASGSNHWSLEAWFQGSTGLGDFGGPAILTAGYDGANVDFMLGFWNGSGIDNKPNVGFYNGTWKTLHDSVNALDDATWHHIVGTFDGTNFRLYLDSVLIDGPTSAGGTPNTTTQDLYIGRRWDGSQLVTGDYAAVAVYPTDLSSTRIKAHYDAAKARVLTSGWEAGNASDGGVWDITASGSAGTSSPSPRHGTYRADDSATAGFEARLDRPLVEFYSGFGVRWNNSPSARRFAVWKGPTGTAQVSLAIDGSGHIRAGRGDLYQFGGGTELGVGSATITTGSYYFIEVHVVIDGSAGVFEVKVNDSSDISLTSQNTKGDSTYATVARLYVGSDGFSEQHFWDDVYVNDAAGGYETSSFNAVPGTDTPQTIAVTTTVTAALAQAKAKTQAIAATLTGTVAIATTKTKQQAIAVAATLTAALRRRIAKRITPTGPSLIPALTATDNIAVHATATSALPSLKQRAKTTGSGTGFVPRAWSIDLHSPAPIIGATFAGLRLSWTADGPGAIEVDLRPTDINDNWTPGAHTIQVNFGGPVFAGYLERLEQSGPPGDIRYTASGIGFASRLDHRIVRHEFSILDHTDVIVSNLLDEAQNQYNGNMGFSMGDVQGVTANRERDYCFGVVIGDAIRELAQIGNGFDWEVDANGNLNIWQNTRGVHTGKTLQIEDTNSWAVTADTGDTLTNVSAIGAQEQPFGPIHRLSYSPGLSNVYGRREEAIDVDSTKEDELFNNADQELSQRAGARMQVQTMWIDERGPWPFGDVWLQDIVSVVLPTYFGGTQDMRCTEIDVSLEPGLHYFVEHTFEALCVDITEAQDDGP